MAVLVNDTFTDTAGVLATAHTTDTGESWVQHPASAGDGVITDANRLRGNIGGLVMLMSSEIPGSADYSVEIKIVRKTTITSDQPSALGRLDATANTYYMARVNPVTGEVQLYKVVAGTPTAIGTPFTYGVLTADQVYTLKLEMIGSTIRAYFEGVQRISVTDTAISAIGRAGVRFSFAGGTVVTSNTTGVHVDQFTLDGTAAAAAPGNTVAPAITTDGTPQEGETISCSTGTWTNSPTGYTYQWQRNGSNISGATSSSYLLQAADVDASVRCVVTATNAGGSASANSNAVTPAAANVASWREVRTYRYSQGAWA